MNAIQKSQLISQAPNKQEKEPGRRDISLNEIKSLRYFQTVYLLPHKFFEELENYAKRNAYAINNSILDIDQKVCLMCLKAHALAIADSDTDANRIKRIKSFLNILDAPISHNGYYMDKDELRALPPFFVH